MSFNQSKIEINPEDQHYVSMYKERLEKKDAENNEKFMSLCRDVVADCEEIMKAYEENKKSTYYKNAEFIKKIFSVPLTEPKVTWGFFCESPESMFATLSNNGFYMDLTDSGFDPKFIEYNGSSEFFKFPRSKKIDTAAPGSLYKDELPWKNDSWRRGRHEEDVKKFVKYEKMNEKYEIIRKAVIDDCNEIITKYKDYPDSVHIQNANHIMEIYKQSLPLIGEKWKNSTNPEVYFEIFLENNFYMNKDEEQDKGNKNGPGKFFEFPRTSKVGDIGIEVFNLKNWKQDKI